MRHGGWTISSNFCNGRLVRSFDGWARQSQSLPSNYWCSGLSQSRRRYLPLTHRNGPPNRLPYSLVRDPSNPQTFELECFVVGSLRRALCDGVSRSLVRAAPSIDDRLSRHSSVAADRVLQLPLADGRASPWLQARSERELSILCRRSDQRPPRAASTLLERHRYKCGSPSATSLLVSAQHSAREAVPHASGAVALKPPTANGPAASTATEKLAKNIRPKLRKHNPLEPKRSTRSAFKETR
jgi:hypothetical protein